MEQLLGGIDPDMTGQGVDRRIRVGVIDAAPVVGETGVFPRMAERDPGPAVSMLRTMASELLNSPDLLALAAADQS